MKPGTVFDTEKFQFALDLHRRWLGNDWRGVAEQAGISEATLSRLKRGRTLSVDSFLALCRWAKLDANDFIQPAAIGKRATP